MSMPLRIMLYVFIGSEPENGGLERKENIFNINSRYDIRVWELKIVLGHSLKDIFSISDTV